MDLTIEQIKYLEDRRREIQRELGDINRAPQVPPYNDVNERKIELQDELDRVEAELERAVAD